MSSRSKPDEALKQTIAEWVGQHADEMAQLLADLVAIPTENPPGENYRKCADALERRLRDAGLVCERVETEGEAACLFAEQGEGERVLYFHGHYDVVPAQAYEQFAVRREGNFLFGRGTCDMKSGLVAMLYAARALKECAVPLVGRLALVMVPDEETGGARGSAFLANKGLLGRGGIGMLTAEPTTGVIWNANRGAMTLRINVEGKSAHVGLQHSGENAFECMHLVVARLLELKREVEERQTAHNVGLANDPAEVTHADRKGPRNSILLIGGASGGGTNFNIVPDNCWFTVDRRINPEEDFETEKARLIGLLQECRRDGIRLTWEILQEAPSANCSESEPLGRALARSVEGVTGQAARFEMCPGLLEIRFYAARGIPAYAYGPGLLSVAHGPKEYVDFRKVRQSAVIYALTAAEILGAVQRV
jgi:succinyl-diaminopimelate desuccinylase